MQVTLPVDWGHSQAYLFIVSLFCFYWNTFAQKR